MKIVLEVVKYYCKTVLSNYEFKLLNRVLATSEKVWNFSLNKKSN